ncbi:Sir2 histone deacetylase Hst2 [Arachnomyces sp. PD_36]|nr:Sir2 histone deacetylase Hst2 [Arachnomyces sp. PD_36]
MGNESSALMDENTPPKTLESRSIESVAKYIKENSIRRIVVMTGAGISTSAGIPDYRSPETGIYANLARLNLPDPEAVFDISFFQRNPRPFYTVARELFPGRFRPTITHSFLKLLYDKGRLLKLFTQNIDGLERLAGVPPELMVEAHGSFATQHCIKCNESYPDDLMKQAIDKAEPPYCLSPDCGGLVKPDVVFFGQGLPDVFSLNRTLPAAADLCIILGTSLCVQPFASLPSFCKEGVPRILINMERVGGLGSRPDDVLLLGDCDDGVRKFAEALGWLDELEALWADTELRPTDEESQETSPKSKDEQLQEQLDRLTEEVDRTLNISNNHLERTQQHLESKDRREITPDQDSQTGEEPSDVNPSEAKPSEAKEKEPAAPIENVVKVSGVLVSLGGPKS